MKKIKDERLMLITLKNTRIAYLIQTIGILAILIYNQITSDLNSGFESPIFFVLMVSMTIFLFLQMRVSVDVEASKRKKHEPLPYYAFFLISLGIGLFIGLVTFFVNQSHPATALTTGIVFFFSFLGSFSFMHYLRKKRSDDNDEN